MRLFKGRMFAFDLFTINLTPDEKGIEIVTIETTYSISSLLAVDWFSDVEWHFDFLFLRNPLKRFRECCKK